MTVFELSNKSLTVRVNSFGAELCSVISNDNGIEYIWQGEPSVWARHAPNLFPVVGKLKNGSYTYLSLEYQLPQHGFARDSEFMCIAQKENSLLFELTATEESLKKFPFHFCFQVKYILTDNQLKIIYSVFNPDNTAMYFSVGAHPAFNCPLQPNELFTDYELIFPSEKLLTVNLLNDGLITDQTKEIELNNHKLNLSMELFNRDALVCLNKQIEEVHLISSKTNHGVSLASVNWPYYGIWTKKDTEHFVCLEPWYGIADSVDADGDIIKKAGIIKLEPQQDFNCSYGLTFF